MKWKKNMFQTTNQYGWFSHLNCHRNCPLLRLITRGYVISHWMQSYVRCLYPSTIRQAYYVAFCLLRLPKMLLNQCPINLSIVLQSVKHQSDD
jgi:hypothetical protein